MEYEVIRFKFKDVHVGEAELTRLHTQSKLCHGTRLPDRRNEMGCANWPLKKYDILIDSWESAVHDYLKWERYNWYGIENLKAMPFNLPVGNPSLTHQVTNSFS